MSRVSGAHLCGFASGPTLQGCSGGESLATCGRFEPHTSRTRCERVTTCAIWPVKIFFL